MSLNMLNILLWPLFVGLGLAVAAIIGIGVGTYRAATHKRRQNKKLLKSLDNGKRNVNLADLKKTKNNKSVNENSQEEVIVDSQLEQRKQNLQQENQEEVENVDLDNIVLNSNYEIRKQQGNKKEEYNWTLVSDSSDTVEYTFLVEDNDDTFTK